MVDAKTPECARAAYMATMPRVPAYHAGKHAPAQACRFFSGLLRGTLPCFHFLDQQAPAARQRRPSVPSSLRAMPPARQVGRHSHEPGRPALGNDMVDDLRIESDFRQQAQARLDELSAEVKMMRVSSMGAATFEERMEAVLSPTRDPRVPPPRPHLTPLDVGPESPRRGTAPAAFGAYSYDC